MLTRITPDVKLAEEEYPWTERAYRDADGRLFCPHHALDKSGLEEIHIEETPRMLGCATCRKIFTNVIISDPTEIAEWADELLDTPWLFPCAPLTATNRIRYGNRFYTSGPGGTRRWGTDAWREASEEECLAALPYAYELYEYGLLAVVMFTNKGWYVAAYTPGEARRQQ